MGRNAWVVGAPFGLPHRLHICIRNVSGGNPSAKLSTLENSKYSLLGLEGILLGYSAAKRTRRESAIIGTGTKCSAFFASNLKAGE